VDNASPLEVQIELSQDLLKVEEKGLKRVNGENTSIRREQTEPHVAVTSSATLVPEPSPGIVQASIVTSSQVSCCTNKPTDIAHITKKCSQKQSCKKKVFSY
jgi:hypothetical protein